MLADSSSETRLSEFERQVRDALLHLYEPAYLETHGLVRREEMSSASAGRLGSHLFQALRNAIEAIHPPAGSPTDSRAWRLYRLIELRYVEGLSASEAIERLAISKSQYQRDHAKALTAIASLLKNQWGHREAPSKPAGSRESLVLGEAQFLAINRQADFVDVGEVVADVVALLQPIVEESGAEIFIQGSNSDTTLRTDRVILRQILMELLGASLEQNCARSLTISLSSDGSGIVVMLQSTACGEVRATSDVDVAAHLVATLGGRLLVERDDAPGIWRARVWFPVSYRPIVLIVDNHPDFIELVTRYLAEDCWDAISAESVPQARALALKWRPDVILLDVMMPEQDGWELIRDLKGQPTTQTIPIVVCSVLYEPRVARALGADAYIAKPITRLALGQVLAPYRNPAGRRESEPSL